MIEKQISFAIEYELFESQLVSFLQENQDKLNLASITGPRSSFQTLKIEVFVHLAFRKYDQVSKAFTNYVRELSDPSAKVLHESGDAISNYLHERGYFEIAEQIEILTKLWLDEKNGEKPGLKGESTYLTAIGHISLMGYLVMGRLSGVIPPAEISIIHEPKKIASAVLANLIIEKSKNTDIKFEPYDFTKFTENSLELYPSLNGYTIARNLYEEIFETYGQQFSKSLLCFADLSPEIVNTAESLLAKHGVPADSKYVGIHVRENQSASRANRNSRFISILPALEYLESLGYVTVRLGLWNRKELSRAPKKLHGVDFTKSSITRLQRDCLQLYIWSKSEFFIGNLSGGTFPPSLFGIPTIYFDVFPLKHFIPPSKMDFVLPKRLYNLVDDEIFPFKEVFSSEFNYLQIENTIRLQALGFGLKSTTSNEMIAAIDKMISRKSGVTLCTENNDSILDFETSIRAAQLLKRMPFDY